jgi:hypothetical protein
VRLDNILEKWVEYSPKNETLKKNYFYTSNRSISRSGYVMKNVDSNGGTVAKRNPKSMKFFFFEIETSNKVQSFFSERDAFSACKTSLFKSFTSLIRMEWTKASLVGMDGIIFFYILIKYLKNFFVLPALLSNENNSSNHHNSYSKGPNLAFFSFTKSPSNSLLTIIFPKNHITSFYHSNMPKIAKAKFWWILGVKQVNDLNLKCGN